MVRFQGYSWGNVLSEQRSDGNETASCETEEDVGRSGQSTVAVVTPGGSSWSTASAGAAGGPRTRATRTPIVSRRAARGGGRS